MKRLISTLFFSFIISLCVFSDVQYNRIVSLAPSFTQSLYYMGAQDKIVACTSYCSFAKKDKKPIVATAIKVSIEKIVSLKPDLVLASGLTDPKDIETLKKFNIKVEVIKSPKSFDEICSQFILLGEFSGKRSKAETIVKSSRQKAEKILQQTKKNNNNPNIFFQIGSDPIFAVLDNTFMADYIKYMGARNSMSGLSEGTIGREYVIAKNPDYIFITTMGISGDTEKKIWSRYTNIKAVKNNRIYIINSEIACQPTPITFVLTLEAMYKKMK